MKFHLVLKEFKFNILVLFQNEVDVVREMDSVLLIVLRDLSQIRSECVGMHQGTFIK